MGAALRPEGLESPLTKFVPMGPSQQTIKKEAHGEVPCTDLLRSTACGHHPFPAAAEQNLHCSRVFRQIQGKDTARLAGRTLVYGESLVHGFSAADVHRALLVTRNLHPAAEPQVPRQVGGGLGLYLAQGIMTRQRGYISVKSKLNEGSTFSVYLLNQYTGTM